MRACAPDHRRFRTPPCTRTHARARAPTRTRPRSPARPTLEVRGAEHTTNLYISLSSSSLPAQRHRMSPHSAPSSELQRLQDMVRAALKRTGGTGDEVAFQLPSFHVSPAIARVSARVMGEPAVEVQDHGQAFVVSEVHARVVEVEYECLRSGGLARPLTRAHARTHAHALTRMRARVPVPRRGRARGDEADCGPAARRVHGDGGVEEGVSRGARVQPAGDRQGRPARGEGEGGGAAGGGGRAVQGGAQDAPGCGQGYVRACVQRGVGRVGRGKRAPARSHAAVAGVVVDEYSPSTHSRLVTEPAKTFWLAAVNNDTVTIGRPHARASNPVVSVAVVGDAARGGNVSVASPKDLDVVAECRGAGQATVTVTVPVATEVRVPRCTRARVCSRALLTRAHGRRRESPLSFSSRSCATARRRAIPRNRWCTRRGRWRSSSRDCECGLRALASAPAHPCGPLLRAALSPWWVASWACICTGGCSGGCVSVHTHTRAHPHAHILTPPPHRTAETLLCAAHVSSAVHHSCCVSAHNLPPAEPAHQTPPRLGGVGETMQPFCGVCARLLRSRASAPPP